MNVSALLVIAGATLGLSFAALFLFARRINNYGIVDIAWSYAFGFLAVFYGVAGTGWVVRRALIAGMVAVWSLRLGTHLAVRVIGHHPVEDGRYQQLRRDWQRNFAAKMAAFFVMQAASVVVLGAPFLIAAQNDRPVLHPLEMVGALLWLISICGEGLADAQLSAFKRISQNRGKVCDIGLWRFSRHPNYFFEWMIWVSFFVFALASPFGCIAVVGPASILWLLLRVTGIPMTEEQSIRSRGDAYRRYQETTSAFVPLPKRRARGDLKETL